MSRRVLLLEPYEAVADLIMELLDELDYEAVIETSGRLDAEVLKSGTYHCVLVNLDQNRSTWRDYGLKLAAMASERGVPVIMIPDHEIAAKTIDANGWLRLEKPFTAQGLQKVLARATGEWCGDNAEHAQPQRP